MLEKELLLFCDESDRDGTYYSDFYGGVLVGASQYMQVTERISGLKQSLNIHGEVKWEKVSASYLEKYKVLISGFFDEVHAGHLKVRIMFHHNARVASNLTHEQKDTTYFRLYYQFIKHAFGFRYMPKGDEPVFLRLFFDEFPDKRVHADRFKGFIYGLQELDQFKVANLRIRMRDIVEVKSHDHVLMQCLDMVLGSMSFRLNDKHLVKAPGATQRGKRTIAKEKLYKHILGEVRKGKPDFNIGISTGIDGEIKNRWHHPYRHWAFLPQEHEYDQTRTKRKGNQK